MDESLISSNQIMITRGRGSRHRWWWWSALFLFACSTSQFFSVLLFVRTYEQPASVLPSHSLRQRESVDCPSQAKAVQAPPCVLIHTVTTPSFRLCTLDPFLDPFSQLAHTTSPTLTKSWPLRSLLKKKDSMSPSLFVVDAAAGIGYFAFQAASLGATVVAVEREESLVRLMKTTKTLNANSRRNFTINIYQGVGCLLQWKHIDILKIDATELLRSCEDVLKNGIKFIFLNFTPKQLTNPVQLLQKMVEMVSFERVLREF